MSLAAQCIRAKWLVGESPDFWIYAKVELIESMDMRLKLSNDNSVVSDVSIRYRLGKYGL